MNYFCCDCTNKFFIYTTNYFSVVLRITFPVCIENYFFIGPRINFCGIANLLFVLQYIAVPAVHFENFASGRVFAKRIPRRNIVGERNERGFHLFLQNLKGSLVLRKSDEVFWPEETTPSDFKTRLYTYP